MSKKIISPSERWSGSVTIADPLTIPQAQLIEDALERPAKSEDGTVWLTVIDSQRLPAIFACVEKWELSNMPDPLTIDNFPASPRRESSQLIEWLFYEINKVYLGEAIVPNE